jgi:glycosyltransferase involved in cell wall biosynthesis
MIAEPSVTVVVPCFNGEAFIGQALASVRSQSFENWELFVVDDGSSDGTAEVVEAIAGEDHRVHLCRQGRGGVSAARNAGAALGSAEILAFLDSDDVWHPDYLARMLAAFSVDAERDIGFARVQLIDRSGRPTGEQMHAKLNGIGVSDLLSGNPAITSSNIVIRRQAFARLGGFLVGMNHAEDQLLLLRAALLGCRIGGIDEVLVSYRTNDAGLSSDLAAMRRGWEALLERVWAEFPNEIRPLALKASARNFLYLGRRALRLRRPPGEALGFVYSAISSHPSALWRWPWPTLPLLVMAVLDAMRPVAYQISNEARR